MSLYEVLKASKTERFPDYWTLLWGRKMSASTIKTLTGVLPLTFTTTEDKLRDWEIRGNDLPGTENLFEGTYRNGYINGSGQYLSGPTVRSAFIKVEANTQYTIKTFDISNRFYVAVYDHLPDYSDTGTLLTYSTAIAEHSYTLTTLADTMYIGVYVSNQSEEPKMVCIKGSTAPDHYIPYQQGVGERTVNLFDSEIEQGTFDTHGEPLYSTKRVRSAAILVTSGNYTVALDGAQRSVCYVYDTYGNFLLDETYSSWRNIPATYNFSGDRLVRFGFSIDNTTNISPSDVTNVMLVKGSTAPTTYIPYGYEIPISCEHNISQDVTYDVDTLLGFNGETLRQPPYQTTSDFIAVTQQKIVLSGTSVNPNNKLIRVCQYDDNKIFLNKLDSTLYGAIDYSFTFTLGSQAKFIKYSFYKTDTDFVAKEVNDYTFYIGSTPLTAGQSISKTSTGVDIELFEGENTVSTTLYNKPEMEINYK